MNEFISDLFEAFTKVNQRYYFAEVYRDIDNFHQNQEAVKQSTENSFSAELFRHWRNIMESYNRVTAYHNLALDFDVRKDWYDEVIIDRTPNSFRPDLVLHLSQLDWDPNFQKVYVEVKTNPEPYIKDDIQKLANSIYRLQFQNGVFISVNSDFSELKTLIRNIVNSETRRLDRYQIQIEWNRIFLFHSIIINGTKSISKPLSFSDIIT